MPTINYHSDELIEIISSNDLIIQEHHIDDSNNNILYKYIENNDIKPFRHFITNNKSFINKRIDYKYLINEACRLGRTEFVIFLIFMGCIMKKDKSGLYPQHYAVLSGKSILLDIMGMFSINLDIQDSNGNTPLHHAVKIKNIEMIKTLLKYGIKKNIHNINGLLPIDYDQTDDYIKNLLNCN